MIHLDKPSEWKKNNPEQHSYRSCIIWIGIIDKQYTVAYSEAMVTDKVLKLFIGLIFKIQSML